ncbi:MAG: hypothetical protein IKP95_08100 [Ruminococcus sp.]|nr:hypothetical protein [Ruminococcus sp.]
MNGFVRDYGVCILLCGIGLFFIVMTLLAMRADRSGVPLMGGLCIALGFLTTPHKWLALLGLLDPVFILFPYFVIRDDLRRKRLKAFMKDKGCPEPAAAPGKQITVSIPERDEELIWGFGYCCIFALNIPTLVFSVCPDGKGGEVLYLDRCKRGGEIEVLPFDGSAVIEGLEKAGKSYTVSITVSSSGEKC